VKSREIRSKFLEYFSGMNHTIVPSSSLVPEKDPTLLFVNAGMVQFKNLFLGIEKRAYTRATTCQKCVRAGGKHNDLENVGKTLRHHTFFEMLGNFSFGDYFKKEAVAYAWEFLKGVLSLDEGRMWVTVFRDDSEAAEIWKSMGVREDRIVRLGEKDNFWSMGDEGPCGPCSEIVYDLGEGVGCRQPTCAVGCDCDRYLEIWNLVFMEFERSKDGRMSRLPQPSIDTGMGLERIASLLQGKIGNYDTDLFTPIFRRLEDISHRLYGEEERISIAMRVIADHVRGATFIINDGVLPSKEGRGYVLRRILRRALRYGKKIGIEKEFLHDLSGIVVDGMADVYPEIKNNHPYIAGVIRGEEERFVETLSVGMRVYEEITDAIRSEQGRTIPGDLVYRLYDTYGFPLDITIEMAAEDGLLVDMEGFDRASREQKERSRASSKIKGDSWEEGHMAVLREGICNEFVGYGQYIDPVGATNITIVADDQIVDSIGKGQKAELFFDKTPFYAESGGQVEDVGYVAWEGGKATVTAVKKVKADLFSHSVIVDEGTLYKGQEVWLKVAKERRGSVARNHTATHLLHFALRTVLGDHVKQSGSLVEPDRLRFDFTHFQAMDDAEIMKVEDIVNEKIMSCFEVFTRIKGREDAIREGATALFEEKYADQVRVLSIGDFSTELCGGTHVKNTGEIGSFYIVSEGSLASGVRRIEAVTGKGAVFHERELDKVIQAISRVSNSEKGRVQERVERLVEELREKEKEIERLKEEITSRRVEEAIQAALERDGVKMISLYVPDAKAEELRRVTDLIRGKVKSCIALVGSTEDAKGMLVVAVTKDLQNRYNAGKIVRNLTERFSGKGGGGPNIAQGGIPGDKVLDALNRLKDVLDA
jgi:alanyl-tRNA synthetase